MAIMNLNKGLETEIAEIRTAKYWLDRAHAELLAEQSEIGEEYRRANAGACEGDMAAMDREQAIRVERVKALGGQLVKL